MARWRIYIKTVHKETGEEVENIINFQGDTREEAIKNMKNWVANIGYNLVHYFAEDTCVR